jgi:hypothetical protein
MSGNFQKDILKFLSKKEMVNLSGHLDMNLLKQQTNMPRWKILVGIAYSLAYKELDQAIILKA